MATRNNDGAEIFARRELILQGGGGGGRGRGGGEKLNIRIGQPTADNVSDTHTHSARGRAARVLPAMLPRMRE